MKNQISKICVMIDILPDSGGGFHLAKSICENIKNQESKKINFRFLTTYPQTKKILEKELKIEIDLFRKESFFNKFFSKLYKIKFFQNFIKFSPLEKYLKNNIFDSIYFISPSYLISQCKKFESYYTIWETQFNDISQFPEYKKNTIHLRNKSFMLAGKYSKKIFVSTNKLADEVKNLYEIDAKKLVYHPIPPYITSKKFNENYTSKNSIINKIIKKKYFFYPAQYWKHKNHEYIVKSIGSMNKEEIDFEIIFSGHDKGYLNYLITLTKDLGLEKYFTFLNYVNDDDLIYLYKNCFALIVPSLVGTHTFPLYEGFFFKKPLIYNSKNLDKKFLNNIINLNIDDLESLIKGITYLNSKNINQMIENNFNLYKKNFSNINLLINHFFES